MNPAPRPPAGPRPTAAFARARAAFAPLAPVALAALAALAAAAAPGCSDDDPAGGGAPAGGERTLRVGAVFSITGGLSSIGAAQRNGARVAVRQMNALGGVLDRPIELVIVDDQSDPQAAARALDELRASGVRVVIGPSGGAAAVELGAKSADGQNVLLIPSTTPDVRRTPPPPGTRPGSGFVFRTAPSDAPQAKALAFFAFNAAEGVKPACASAAIVSTDDEYGNSLGEQFREIFANLPGLISAEIKLPALVQPDSAYVSVAQRVVGAEKKCQVVIATPEVGAAYLRAFRAVARDAPGFDAAGFVTVGSDALKQQDFLVLGRDNPADAASPTAGEGSFIVSPDTAPQGPRYGAFRELYRAQFTNEEPPPFSTNAYDAVILAAMAIQLAGVAEPAPVRDGLLRLAQAGQAYGPGDVARAMLRMREGASFVYAGASGVSTFDSQGGVVCDFVVAQVREGSFVSTSRFFASELE